MKRKIYGFFMLSLILSVGVTSCLNDKNIEDHEYGLIDLNTKKIIEIPASTSHEISLALKPTGFEEITIGEVRLAAENPAAEDIVVSLTNTKSSDILSDKTIFPLDEVIVPATVTIPKGKRSVPLTVSINTDKCADDPQYVAVSISAIDKSGYIISGNFGYVALSLKIKNRYEGRYHVTSGTLVDVASGSLKHISAVYPEYKVQLQTMNSKKLVLYDEEDANYYYLIGSGASISYYGSFCPIFEFDDNGNVVAVTNHYGQPASNTRSAELDPSGINKYDDATKSFTVSYWMNQSSTVATPPHHRTSITETYTFVEDL